jgi:holo-[acyl-carrier protein] synthase
MDNTQPAPFAVGLDLVEIERLRTLLASASFRARCFTPAEQAYCDSHRDPAPSYAARWAAKEAAAKALGTGIAEGVNLIDIEVLRSERGTPSLALHGGAAEKAAALGLRRFALSLSHTATTAAASVMASG